MKSDLFRFYRATAHLFYEDLLKIKDLPEAPVCWISGDLHLENFGSFRGANGQVYFDINDFDDAVMAPVTWELVRLITSIFIAFRSLSIDDVKAKHMARLYLEEYTASLQRRKASYIEPRTARGIVQDFLTAVESRPLKSLMKKRTVNCTKIDRDHPKHLKLNIHLKKELEQHIIGWLRRDDTSPYNYKVVDMVFRLSGTSSLGLERYSILLKSVNHTGDKFMLLDMKEVVASSLQNYVTAAQPAWISQAERILFIQQIMQNHSPSLLSTCRFNDKDYIIQELQPAKDNINFKLIKKNYRDMCRVITDMGMLTASAQLRSAGHRGSSAPDDLVTFAQRKDWQDKLIAISELLASKTVRYYSDFVEDLKNGKLHKGEESKEDLALTA